MKRLMVISALFFLLGGALSAQVIKTEKIKVNKTPVQATEVKRNNQVVTKADKTTKTTRGTTIFDRKNLKVSRKVVLKTK